jgi:hypothetical protein
MRLISALAAAFVAAFTTTAVWADDPTPVSGPTAPGFTYVLKVYPRYSSTGVPAQDGTSVEAVRVLSPKEASPNEKRQFSCGRSTVTNGEARLVAQMSADCPEGSMVAFVVTYPDGSTPIVATALGGLEWRAPRAGELSVRTVTLQTTPPQTASDDGSGAEGAGSRGHLRPEWPLVALAVLLIVAAGVYFGSRGRLRVSQYRQARN